MAVVATTLPTDVQTAAHPRVSLRVGLLGGSFDPVHRAHIALAQTALAELGLDEVQLIPAADPWQRPALAASPAQRLHMLHLAVQGLGGKGLRVNPMEIERGGPSRTLDTLHALPAGPDYHWLLGADQLNNFCTWHRWQDIARCARLVVAQRPDTPLQPAPQLLAHLARLQRPLILLPFAPMPVSATAIRQKLGQALAVSDEQHGDGQAPLADMLHASVRQYIFEQGLYRPPAHSAPPPPPAL